MLRRTASPIFRRSGHLFCILPKFLATYKPDVKNHNTYCVIVMYTNSSTWWMEWVFYDRRSGEKCGEGKFFQAAPIRPSPADLFIVTVMVVVLVAKMVVTIILGPLWSYVEHVQYFLGLIRGWQTKDMIWWPEGHPDPRLGHQTRPPFRFRRLEHSPYVPALVTHLRNRHCHIFVSLYQIII